MAGVHCFSATCFRHEKPRRDHRKRLVMIPSWPIANLVLRHARLALATLDTFLDAMFRLGHAGEFSSLGFLRRIGQIVVMFYMPLFVAQAKYYQHLFLSNASAIGFGKNFTLGNLEYQRVFFAVAGVNLSPIGLGE